MSDTTKKQSFLHGTMLLAMATAIVKVIGALYKIPLNAIIGEQGFGYYSTAYEIYTVLLMISTAGLPVAMSRMISQASSLGNYRQVRKIYTVSRTIFLSLGLIGTLLMTLFCKQLAAFQEQPDAWAAIGTLGPCCFLICLMRAAVMCSIANRAGTKTAFLFALSMIFVRPHVVAVSLQFSCCFLIAFLAMLAVPWIHRHAKWESLFFLELGILTQYFDFYTTPILTFALPMTYLYILKIQDQQAVSLKNLGCNGLSWCAGYGLMWLAKLVLTSLFTPVNALAQGFASFRGRIGIEKVSGMESMYNPIAALRAVFVSLYSDPAGKLVLFAAVAITFALLLVRFLRDKHQSRELLNHWQLLIIAALPVIWFIAAAQPTANHHWFQYRSIAASFWAGFQYLQYLLQRKADTPASRT